MEQRPCHDPAWKLVIGQQAPIVRREKPPNRLDIPVLWKESRLLRLDEQVTGPMM